jgi:hypothetical protein
MASVPQRGRGAVGRPGQGKSSPGVAKGGRSKSKSRIYPAVVEVPHEAPAAEEAVPDQVVEATPDQVVEPTPDQAVLEIFVTPEQLGVPVTREDVKMTQSGGRIRAARRISAETRRQLQARAQPVQLNFQPGALASKALASKAPAPKALAPKALAREPGTQASEAKAPAPQATTKPASGLLGKMSRLGQALGRKLTRRVSASPGLDSVQEVTARGCRDRRAGKRGAFTPAGDQAEPQAKRKVTDDVRRSLTTERAEPIEAAASESRAEPDDRAGEEQREAARQFLRAAPGVLQMVARAQRELGPADRAALEPRWAAIRRVVAGVRK